MNTTSVKWKVWGTSRCSCLPSHGPDGCGPPLAAPGTVECGNCCRNFPRTSLLLKGCSAISGHTSPPRCPLPPLDSIYCRITFLPTLPASHFSSIAELPSITGACLYLFWLQWGPRCIQSPSTGSGSHLCYALTVCSWTSHLTSLGLSFPLWKLGCGENQRSYLQDQVIWERFPNTLDQVWTRPKFGLSSVLPQPSQCPCPPPAPTNREWLHHTTM